MSKVFFHNGKKFTTEEEYFASVVTNGETRNSVSLAAARYYYNCYKKLLTKTKRDSSVVER